MKKFNLFLLLFLSFGLQASDTSDGEYQNPDQLGYQAPQSGVSYSMPVAQQPMYPVMPQQFMPQPGMAQQFMPQPGMAYAQQFMYPVMPQPGIAYSHQGMGQLHGSEIPPLVPFDDIDQYCNREELKETEEEVSSRALVALSRSVVVRDRQDTALGIVSSSLKAHERIHNGSEIPPLVPFDDIEQYCNREELKETEEEVSSRALVALSRSVVVRDRQDTALGIVSSSLKAHERIHTGKNPYACKHCHKVFTHSSSLASHKRTHTGEKRYACKYCDYKATQSSTLTSHERTHTGEKPYVCKHCLMGFAQSSNLKAHKRIHMGEKPYVCKHCHKGFTQSSSLTSHIGNIHRGVLE